MTDAATSSTASTTTPLVECAKDIIELRKEVPSDRIVLRETSKDGRLRTQLQVRLEQNQTMYVSVIGEYISTLKSANVTFQQFSRALLQLIEANRSGALSLPDEATMRVLHLNERHFRPEDLRALKKPVPAVLALPRNGHGLLLHLDQDWDFAEEFPPEEFSNECMELLQSLCWNMGFSYVRIDDDGIVMPGLPFYK